MATTRFDIRLGARSRPILRLFDVRRDEDAFVEIVDDALFARFGWASSREPVRYGPLRVPAWYVTVEDLEGLAAALTERGIDGIDARQDELGADRRSR